MRKHIILDITPAPVDTFPSVSGGFVAEKSEKFLQPLSALPFPVIHAVFRAIRASLHPQRGAV